MNYSLSVIVPNFNNEKFIIQCLQSIINQSFQPSEIIVVDDASTDCSREIISKLATEYNIIKPVFLPQNHGVSHARNIGLREASSDYVTFIDADDYYYCDQKLENEMNLLKEMGGNALIYSQIVFVDEKGVVLEHLSEQNKKTYSGYVYEKFLTRKRGYKTIRDYCFPKSAIIKSGVYDEESSFYEDVDFFIRLAEILPVYCTKGLGTAYRIKGYGLSKRSINETIELKNRVYMKYIYKMRTNNRFCIISQYHVNTLAANITVRLYSYLRKVKANIRG